jgi:hypothetical protein
MGMKECSTCHLVKAYDQFTRGGRCKSCIAAKAREWYAANRERALRRMRVYNTGIGNASRQREIIDGCLRCSHCKALRPISLFHRCKSNPWQRAYDCRYCACAKRQKYRVKKPPS